MGCATEPSIVVGVQGSAGSLRALRWAAEEARRRHALLRVVLAWQPVQLAAYSPVTAHADLGKQERAAHAVLAEALRSAFSTNVPEYVVTKVIEGAAERVLVDESSVADILVLGSAPATPRSGSCVGPVLRVCLKQAQTSAAQPQRVLEGSGAKLR